MINKLIIPPAIKKGAKIGIISPAGAVEASQLESTLKLIEEKGYTPILGKNALGRFDYGYPYSGTEKERAEDLNWALNDTEIEAIWATRGGYGCQHLLEHLNLKNFKKYPKWYIGYSDNTVINSFLLKKGFASVNGQTIKTSSFGVCEEGYDMIFNLLEGKDIHHTLKPHTLNRKGKAKGRLVGGNLALVYALLGTRYSFDFKDNILFIEEIGENFYALDRMLMSLEMAGVFKKIAGLVVGGMINMGKEKDNKDYEASFDAFAYELISKRIERYNFPVIFGFPNGHIFENQPIVIGAETEINIGKTVSFHQKRA